MKFQAFFLIVVATAATTGCRHDSDPAIETDTTHGCLLKTIITSWDFGYDSATFTYDSSNNLISQASYAGHSTIPYISRTYTYKDGLVISADGGLSPVADASPPSHHEDWIYQDKLVSKIESTDVYQDLNYTEHYSTSFSYTNSKLTSFTQVLYDGNTIEGTFTYEYDDITSETLTYTDGTDTPLTRTNNYSGYDGLGNFSRLIGTRLGHQVFLPTFSTPTVRDVTKSNYLHATENGTLYNYTYEYTFDYVSLTKGSEYYNPADLNAGDPPISNSYPIVRRFDYINCK